MPKNNQQQNHNDKHSSLLLRFFVVIFLVVLAFRFKRFSARFAAEAKTTLTNFDNDVDNSNQYFVMHPKSKRQIPSVNWEPDEKVLLSEVTKLNEEAKCAKENDEDPKKVYSDFLKQVQEELLKKGDDALRNPIVTMNYLQHKTKLLHNHVADGASIDEKAISNLTTELTEKANSFYKKVGATFKFNTLISAKMDSIVIMNWYTTYLAITPHEKQMKVKDPLLPLMIKKFELDYRLNDRDKTNLDDNEILAVQNELKKIHQIRDEINPPTYWTKFYRLYYKYKYYVLTIALPTSFIGWAILKNKAEKKRARNFIDTLFDTIMNKDDFTITAMGKNKKNWRVFLVKLTDDDTILYNSGEFIKAHIDIQSIIDTIIFHFSADIQTKPYIKVSAKENSIRFKISPGILDMKPKKTNMITTEIIKTIDCQLSRWTQEIDLLIKKIFQAPEFQHDMLSIPGISLEDNKLRIPLPDALHEVRIITEFGKENIETSRQAAFYDFFKDIFLNEFRKHYDQKSHSLIIPRFIQQKENVITLFKAILDTLHEKANEFSHDLFLKKAKEKERQKTIAAINKQKKDFQEKINSVKNILRKHWKKFGKLECEYIPNTEQYKFTYRQKCKRDRAVYFPRKDSQRKIKQTITAILNLNKDDREEIIFFGKADNILDTLTLPQDLVDRIAAENNTDMFPPEKPSSTFTKQPEMEKHSKEAEKRPKLKKPNQVTKPKQQKPSKKNLEQKPTYLPPHNITREDNIRLHTRKSKFENRKHKLPPKYVGAFRLRENKMAPMVKCGLVIFTANDSHYLKLAQSALQEMLTTPMFNLNSVTQKYYRIYFLTKIYDYLSHCSCGSRVYIFAPESNIVRNALWHKITSICDERLPKTIHSTFFKLQENLSILSTLQKQPYEKVINSCTLINPLHYQTDKMFYLKKIETSIISKLCKLMVSGDINNDMIHFVPAIETEIKELQIFLKNPSDKRSEFMGIFQAYQDILTLVRIETAENNSYLGKEILQKIIIALRHLDDQTKNTLKFHLKKTLNIDINLDSKQIATEVVKLFITDKKILGNDYTKVHACLMNYFFKILKNEMTVFLVAKSKHLYNQDTPNHKAFRSMFLFDELKNSITDTLNNISYPGLPPKIKIASAPKRLGMFLHDLKILKQQAKNKVDFIEETDALQKAMLVLIALIGALLPENSFGGKSLDDCFAPEEQKLRKIIIGIDINVRHPQQTSNKKKYIVDVNLFENEENFQNLLDIVSEILSSPSLLKVAEYPATSIPNLMFFPTLPNETEEKTKHHKSIRSIYYM